MWVEDCASTSSVTGSISGYSTPYKFTGKELDKETGLYYFGARYYDARMSRWISTDPALVMYVSGKPNGGVYNPINIDLYRYAQNRPILWVDPNGMWEDKSITVGYEDKGVERTKEINMGTVTEGDTLVKLAEMQLKEERGNGKFSGKEVRNKIEQIKQLNNLESDTIKVGQNLILGFSNERVIGEKGVERSDIDLLIAGGMAYGLTKAGIAGAAMLMNAALSTEAGVTASLYAGAMSAAVQLGMQNGTLMVNAIQSIPGIGNMMLMYGPQINQYGRAFINGFMPSGTSTFNNINEAASWFAGYITEKLVNK